MQEKYQLGFETKRLFLGALYSRVVLLLSPVCMVLVLLSFLFPPLSPIRQVAFHALCVNSVQLQLNLFQVKKKCVKNSLHLQKQVGKKCQAYTGNKQLCLKIILPLLLTIITHL